MQSSYGHDSNVTDFSIPFIKQNGTNNQKFTMIKIQVKKAGFYYRHQLEL